MTGSGSEDWIDALGPDADSSGLRISGDKRLATALLEGVGAIAERNVQVA